MTAVPDESAHDLLEQIRISFLKDPIDFSEKGNAAGEANYLGKAIPSYLRTLQDIEQIFEASLTGRKILEIGSYFGMLAVALARRGAEITAFDLPQYMDHPQLRHRLTAAGVTPLTGDLRDPQFTNLAGQFDLIVMCETIEHLPFNPIPSLRAINSALAPAGRLYLSQPNLASLSNRKRILLGQSHHNPIGDYFLQLDPTVDFSVGLHWREYTASEIRELLTRLGWTIERQYYHYSTDDKFSARMIYRYLPSLRPNVTTIASKS